MHKIERIRDIPQIDERFKIEKLFTDAFGIDAGQNYGGKCNNRNKIGHRKSHYDYDEDHS